MWKFYNSNIKKVAILRALQLGDMLCAVPAVRAIKESLPEVSISLIGLPWAKQFTDRFDHYFDGFVEFPGFPGLPEQPFDSSRYVEFLDLMNKRKFDLIIQMHGNGTIINRTLPMMGARNYAGYFTDKAFNPSPGNFMLYPDNGSEVSRHLSLVNFLGIKNSDQRLEWAISPNEIREFAKLKSELELQTGKYVVIHPGARDLKRWWPAEKFAKVADRFCQLGYKVVMTGIPSEAAIADSVSSLMKNKCINLVGKTNLGMVALLIKEAAMLFSNDTGVSHISAAVQTPSVVIFLTSDPARWAPLNRNIHQIILPAESEDTNYVLNKAEKTLLKQIA